MKSLDVANFLQALDQDLRLGRASAARWKLLKVNLSEIPRESLVSFAQIARRLNLPEIILKILTPVVRPAFSVVSSNQHTNGTDAERALYAVGLTRIGAYSEAREILDGVNEKAFPEVTLFRAHVEIFNWNYSMAADLLRKYRKTIKDPYQLLVCDVNLLAAFLHSSRESEFLDRIGGALERAESGGYALIAGNLFELLGQYHIVRGDFTKAVNSLETAFSNLSQAPAQYLLYVRKWKIFAEFLKNPFVKDVISEMLKFREECIQRREWETLRECDFYLALGKKDKFLFFNVYQGSPFEGYREKMLRLGERFHVLNGSESQKSIFKSQRQIELRNIREEPLELVESQKNKIQVNDLPSGVLRNLLVSLTKDSYRPQMVGEIFSAVYPNEYFSQTHSNDRVLKLANRLRDWFRSQNLPLQLEIEKKKYFLNAKSFVLLNESQAAQKDQKEHWTSSQKRNFSVLQKHFSELAFSADELAFRLGLSVSATRRWIQWAKAKGLILGGSGSGWKKYRIGDSIGIYRQI